jgi:pimeloyl-ACP methyl ester carboxylesterase
VALLDSVDAYTLLRRRLAEPRPARTLSPIDAARKLTAYEPPDERPGARPASTSIFRYEGLRRVETHAVWPEPDVVVPGEVVSWRAHTGLKRALLWIAPGDAEQSRRRSPYASLISSLLSAGWLVATADVRGTGLTAPRSTGRANPSVMGAEAFLTYESFIAGRPLLGMRVRDAACAVEYLLDRPDVDASAGVALVGWGEGGLIALHLAAFDARVCSVATVNSPASYGAAVERERYTLPASGMVPGIVVGPDSANGYDLDDLVAAIAPRPVLRQRSLDGAGLPPTEETDERVAARLGAWLTGPAR